MKVLLTIVGTACVFAAGVFAGMWIQRTQPVPAPPIGVMGEIRDVPLTASSTPAAAAPAKAPVATDGVKLSAQIERMKPDIEAFRQKLEPIKTEFRDNLDAVLRPEQREKLKAWNERNTEKTENKDSKDVKEAKGKPHRPPRDGLDSLFPIVLVPATLEKISAELQLDEAQKQAVQALLLKRRAKFLELVDATPPPSLNLGKIAPLVPQVAQPPTK